MVGVVKGPVRPYDRSGRLQLSRERQVRVAEVTARLLVARGYAATTIADIAAAAQVSVPWLYKLFGPKPELVKRAYDVLLAGDPDPVPLAVRPAFRAFATETDPYRAVERYAAISRDLISRVGPLAAALLAAGHSAGGDVAALAETIGRERLEGATAVSGHLADLGGLAPGVSREEARDMIWTLISPEVYRMLVVERGWSDLGYERWLAQALKGSLLGGP
jgi:AcrR family transcriptional regulator